MQEKSHFGAIFLVFSGVRCKGGDLLAWKSAIIKPVAEIEHVHE